MIKKLFCKTTPENSLSSETVMTLLRVTTGVLMALLHGMGKVPPSEEFVAGVEALGFPMPSLFAWAAGLSELVGGIFLALGLFTRPSAFFIAFTMFVAAFGRHMNDPFDVKESSLIYMAIALVFFIKGSGRFSIDNFLGKK